MIAAWMLWSIGMGALLLVAGFAAEKLLEGSRRWVWAVAGAGTVALTAARVFSGTAAGSGGAAMGVSVVEGPGASAAAGTGGALEGALSSGPLAWSVPGDSLLHVFDGPLLLAWLAVSVVLAVAALIGAGTFLRRRRDWKPGKLLGHDVLWSRETGPAVVGLVRPRVVLPFWVGGVEQSGQRLILAHEDEHRRAGDAVLRFAAAALLIAFPWNPALWFHYRRLCLAIELDCDDRVMQRLPHRRWLYGDLLFRVGQRGEVPPGFALAAFAEQKSFLERRIRKLLSKAPEVGMAQIAFLAFAAILVIGVAVWVPGITREAEQADAESEVEAAGDAAELIRDANPVFEVNIQPIGDGEENPAEVKVLPFNDRVEAEMLLPPGAELIEVEGLPEPLPEAGAIESEPRFVVHTVRPVLLNEEEVREAIAEEYPALLKDAGIGGTVIVHLFIDTDGRVRNQLVKETSGHRALDEAALRVAPVAVFSPAQNRETPVALWVEMPFTFKLPPE